MLHLIDYKKEYQRIDRLYRLAVLVYSIVACALLTAILTIYFTSNEDYLLVMLIDIILTIILTWGTIYFFTNPFKMINYQRTFYKDLAMGLFEESIVIFKNQTFDKAIIRGVELLKATAIEHIKDIDYQRDIYLLKSVDGLPFEVPIKVKTFANVLVSYEVVE